MEINTESDVDKLLDMGLDGYTPEITQKGGNGKAVPVFVMNIQVLKTLDLFKDTPKDARFNKMNGYYGFIIGRKKEASEKIYFPLFLLTTLPNNEITFSNFTEIAHISLKANTDITLNEFLEILFQYVTTGNTDYLLTLMSLDKTTSLVGLFLNAPTIQQTDIEEFSKSLSMIHSISGETSRSLLTETSGDSWLVSNIKARLGDGLSDNIQNELTNERWQVVANAGGGDCFFLSLCQSGVSIQTLENPTSINPSDSTCVNSIREFIANHITEETYKTRMAIPADIEHAPPESARKSIEAFKEYVKTSRYYADEMAISILQEKTNLYPIIINRDLRYTPNKPVIKCHSTNASLIDLQKKQFVILNHIEGGGGHYELIQFKMNDIWKSVFSIFDELPKSIQALMNIDCLQA